MDPLKMYILLKMVVFHCYVSLPKGKSLVNSQWQTRHLAHFFASSAKPCHADAWATCFSDLQKAVRKTVGTKQGKVVFYVITGYMDVSKNRGKTTKMDGL